jgi:hypothetical protein
LDIGAQLLFATTYRVIVITSSLSDNKFGFSSVSLNRACKRGTVGFDDAPDLH